MTHKEVVTTTAQHSGLGVRSAGRCPVCGSQTGSRDWEKKATCRYTTDAGEEVPVHPSCVGAMTKNSGGQLKYRWEPKTTEIKVTMARYVDVDIRG